ncbi:MAG: hypothetical protein U9N73_01930 [Candidatus Auribacterota bacterium]|nr:hypothetical protein [Candidatus Auribacterota bacterium]
MNETRLKKTDWLILSGLLGLTAAFFLPLLVGWEKFFYDDIAFTFYPQQVFLSRCLRDGVIPWWNPQLCAGATPFYAHVFQSSLSPINWLFLSLGAIDPVRDYFWLIKVPLCVYYLMAAIFSYFFSRRGLSLNPAGSFIFSLAYTFSPSMIYFSTAPAEVLIQAWLPLICLSLVRFSHDGSYRWLIFGGLAVAFMSPSGDVPVVIHVTFITSLFGAGLLVLFFLRRDWKRGFRVVGGGVAIFGVGFLLAGIYWSNMLSGIQMLMADSGEIMDQLSGLPQSMPPLYLINLVIPDFFGGITSHHTWGAAHQIRLSLNDVNLLGGLAASLIALTGFFLAGGRNRTGDRTPSPRELWWLFFAIFIFGLFVVLGRYTPVYGFLRAIIPALQMPYPVRMRSIECFAMAGLIGVSIDLIFRRHLNHILRKTVIYLLFVGILAGLALLYPYHNGKEIFSPGLKQLTVLHDWGWFLKGPVFYLAAGAVLLIFMAAFKGGKYFRTFLIMAVTLELLFFAYQEFYRNRTLNHRYKDFYAERYFGPADEPIYRKILSWRPERNNEPGLYRRLYYRSYFDNLAWLDGSLSMLGFDIKPLDPRFQGVIEELAEGFPYEIKVRHWDSRFWPNMSVRYLLSRQSLAFPHMERRVKVQNEYSYEIPAALPRYYFQNRWQVTDAEEQREELLYSNLRGSGYCDPETWRDQPSPGIISVAIELSEIEEDANFNDLQEKNIVTAFDLSDPNRIRIDVKVAAPSMLVMTDLYHPDWRATMNGKPVPIHRVNYLQRGIWCPPGEYQIMMIFRPGSLTRGLVGTAIGILVFSGLILMAVRQGRKRRWDETTGNG